MTKEKYCIQNRKYYSFYKPEIKNKKFRKELPVRSNV